MDGNNITHISCEINKMMNTCKHNNHRIKLIKSI